MQGEPHVTLFGLPYDFRLYSLLLFGVLVAYYAVRGMMAANRMTKHARQGIRSAIRNDLAVVLVSVPAIPLSDIAIVAAVPCIIAAAALYFVKDAAMRGTPHRTVLAVESSR